MIPSPGAMLEREERFDAIFDELRAIAESPRPIEEEERALFLEIREYLPKLEAAREAGDVPAMTHWIDTLILIGDTILGRLHAQGFTTSRNG